MDILINHTGYDITDYFRLADMEVQKMVVNAAYNDFADVYLVNCLS